MDKGASSAAGGVSKSPLRDTWATATCTAVTLPTQLNVVFMYPHKNQCTRATLHDYDWCSCIYMLHCRIALNRRPTVVLQLYFLRESATMHDWFSRTSAICTRPTVVLFCIWCAKAENRALSADVLAIHELYRNNAVPGPKCIRDVREVAITFEIEF